MAVTGVTGTSILLKIRWRYANMLIFHLHNLLKPFGFSPRTWHCIFPSLAVDGSKRPQDEKPLALVISCTWSMLPWRHDVRWSRVWRSLGHQRFEAKIFMLWDAQPKSVLLQPSDHPSFTNYYILLHINTIIMLHLWNQRSPSNRCDLKLSAAYMLLQHVDRDTDVSPIHFLSWISKQFCVPTRRCKLTTGWPFWCHGDSHGKASHGRMDSSRVHYAMWGDHKNTKRLQVVFESLTWTVFDFWFQFQDAVLGRIHFTETGELVYLTTAGDGPRLCRMCFEFRSRWPKLVPWVAFRTSWDVVLANGFTKDLSSLSSWIFFSTRLG